MGGEGAVSLRFHSLAWPPPRAARTKSVCCVWSPGDKSSESTVQEKGASLPLGDVSEDCSEARTHARYGTNSAIRRRMWIETSGSASDSARTHSSLLLINAFERDIVALCSCVKEATEFELMRAYCRSVPPCGDCPAITVNSNVKTTFVRPRMLCDSSLFTMC